MDLPQLTVEFLFQDVFPGHAGVAADPPPAGQNRLIAKTPKVQQEPDPLPYVRSWLGNEPACEPPLEALLPALLERAESEGVTGILAAQLHPPPESLKTAATGWFVAGAKLVLAFNQLGEALSEKGLEVVALKGAALAPTVYGGQLSCRPMSDLDLLVLPEQETAVKELVGQLSCPVAIDWHSHLVNVHRIPCNINLLRLTPQELWELSLPWQAGVRHLRPELQFVHLSLHAFKHSCCRLLWLVDQALVLRQCDRSCLLELAHRVGAERPVLVSLHLLRELLHEPLPNLPPLRWHERLAVRLARWRGSKVGWGEFFLALSVPGTANKLRYLHQYIFPGPEVLGVHGPTGRFKAALRRAWRFLTNENRTLG